MFNEITTEELYALNSSVYMPAYEFQSVFLPEECSKR